ncbi:stalk domain-containing protein [Lysinibacillus sp. BW-2-10]|uniref:L,D-transpeptidase family protein n=1 Tax=Lysinibacillus sp. BW-2-10 TaxID=2590030 RepID=UPI00117E545D|nr:stalk domain-containing protein [Lysinibacillus sp. BW-2-10]TSI04749.1 L,D-transpeptidase family protein [Lysinibacillus sp. BW-2-10]
MKKVGFLFVMIVMLLLPHAASAEENQLIIVNKATNQLAFYDHGELVKTFPVGTGKKDNLTPEGTFPIVNKIKNRPYYSGGIPGGSPNNPLGDRWLGLNARGTYGTTYAIHGNNNEDSIGKYVSGGCIRMHNEDVRWLFDQVEVGTNVKIVNSSKSFNDIAKASGYQLTPPIKIMLDGKEIKVDSEPFIQNNRVLVPMRSIFTALGADVHWDSSTGTITATKKWDTIKLTINSKQAIINDQTHALDVPPLLQKNRTYVPTRFISEALGIEVKWDNKNRIVSLISPKPPTRAIIDVTINGQMVKKGGFIEEAISLVQVNAILSSLGVTPQYDGKNSTLTISYDETTLVVTSNKKQGTLNGENITLPKAAVIVDGHFYVPAITIADAFGGTLQYDSATKHLVMTLPEIVEEETYDNEISPIESTEIIK